MGGQRADALERHDRVHDGDVRAVGRYVAAAERDRMALADEGEVPRRLAAVVIVLACRSSYTGSGRSGTSRRFLRS